MRTLVSPVALPYQARIKNHFGSGLLAFFPLDETAGTTVYDRSGNARNGTYTLPTLAQYSGLGPKARCGFDGTNGYATINTAAAAMSQSEGSISIMLCPYAAALWTATAYYRCFAMWGANNFEINIYHSSSGTNEIGISVKQNNVSAQTTLNYRHGGTGWVNILVTWSAADNIIRYYRNGILIDTDTPTACAGAVTDGRIARGAGAGAYWRGGLASVMLFNRPVTAIEAKLLATETQIERVTVIGDSISSDVRNKLWPSAWLTGFHNGQAEIIRGGTASSAIVAAGGKSLATQVAEAAQDDASTVIIALGTSDNDAGDMAILQAEVEEQLVELKRTNPRCVPYYMNVLPRWTNNTTGPEVAKGNIRAAIAAACVAQGVTCWDTYTEPWITQAQTADGLHPTSATWSGSGHEAITNKILERLV